MSEVMINTITAFIVSIIVSLPIVLMTIRR